MTPDKDSRSDLALRALERRRWRDFAGILPVFGTLLLVSPIVTVFTGGRIFGMPLIFVFVYGIWLFLILLAWRISRRIDADTPDG